MVHLAAGELFKLLNQKAVAVGDMIAQRRRMPSAKAFDFFLESTFVEVGRQFFLFFFLFFSYFSYCQILFGRVRFAVLLCRFGRLGGGICVVCGLCLWR